MAKDMSKNSQNLPTKGQKLTPELKMAVIKMYGAMMSPSEIVAALKKNYDVTVTYNCIYLMKGSPKNIYKIDAERQKFLKDLEEVPIFHPKIRFQRAENLYNDGLEKQDSDQMINAIKLAQNEFKDKIGGDTYNVWNQNNQFNMEMSMEEIALRKEEIFRKLKSKEVIDGPSGKTGEDSGK